MLQSDYYEELISHPGPFRVRISAVAATFSVAVSLLCVTAVGDGLTGHIQCFRSMPSTIRVVYMYVDVSMFFFSKRVPQSCNVRLEYESADECF